MDTAVDSSKAQFEQVVVDEVVLQSPELDKDLTEELSCSREIPDFPVLISHTTCTYDFYEGKIILDCPFPPKHKAKSLCSYVGKTIHATEAQEGPQGQTHLIPWSLFSGQSRVRTFRTRSTNFGTLPGQDLLC